MNSKAIIATIVGIFGLIATVWGSVTVLDARYEQKIVHESEHAVIQSSFDNFSYTILKREIREIREEILHADDPQHTAELRLALQDAIDRLCRQFPHDRECR
jgi:hypothetical protein